MSNELAPKYDPAAVEPEIAQRWSPDGDDVKRAFRSDPNATGQPYCIVIPPPNVTAALHMGHALNNTLQDILIRYHRMLGDNTVWIPGTDHAGIATQTVVDKRLQAEGKPALKDYKRLEAEGKPGREPFIEKVQAWKDEYEQRITDQLKAMGCSCDWDRQRFTMDAVCAKAVREAFFRLFKDGLIYRGKRLVNWDPATQTALADDEVEMREIDGHFWYLKYPLVDDDGRDTGEYVTVATTRPETMLGDTAVAVNPKDEKRSHLIGHRCRLPIVNRSIPVIGDDYVVIPDPESDDPKARYASGFLKVTPAHDPNDWDIGQRHDLPVINVMAPDGSISDQHGWPPEDFKNADAEAVPLGLDRYEAREAIVDWFRKNKLLEEVKPYTHSVGHSYRSHVPIEPYLSDQWYVGVTKQIPSLPDDGQWLGTDLPKNSLAGLALQALADGSSKGSVHEWAGKLQFHPTRYANTFRGWHENIRDWCISRQLWWGHRIPVWVIRSRVSVSNPTQYLQDLRDAVNKYFDAKGLVDQFVVGQGKNHREWVICSRSDRADDAIRDFDQYLPLSDTTTVPQHAKPLRRLVKSLLRDPDVLDTWFSSALWPFSTLGWPQDTNELETWNPGSVLCTAREIITLWVSRMVMFNLYFLDRLPFTDVFIHAMIQDGDGRKMSKSLGNGVDPLDIIHSHGSDAMRYTLAAMTTQTQDVRMPVAKDPDTGRNTSEKFDLGRNFSNKLWNAARFALMNLELKDSDPVTFKLDRDSFDLASRWILSRLARTVGDTNAALDQYEFSHYAQGLYDFFWRDLCDWYIEAVKPTVQKDPAQRQVLASCLDASLRLLHPMMPFITEKLWEHLNAIAPYRCDDVIDGVDLPEGELLVTGAWPTIDEGFIDDEAERAFGLIQQVVGALRQTRTTHQTPPRQTVKMSIQAPQALVDQLTTHSKLIETLANVELAEAGSDVDKPADAAATLVEGASLFLHGLLDADAERTRLSKRLEEINKSVAALQGRLKNKAYVDKAPPHLVQQTRDQLDAARKESQSLQEQLSTL